MISAHHYSQIQGKVLNVVIKPFYRVHHRFHGKIANLADTYGCHEESPLTSVEYDPMYRRYYVEADTKGVNYREGHFAGKVAVVLGMFPAFAAFASMDLIEFGFNAAGSLSNPALNLLWVAVVLTWVFFIVSAILYTFELSISVQQEGVHE